MTDQDEEDGKNSLIKKEPEVAIDKKSKGGVKSKKSYQTDYEGANDEEMKDEGGVVKD